MLVESCICEISIKNTSTKFLTLSKIWLTLTYQLTFHFFINITLRMEVAANIEKTNHSTPLQSRLPPRKETLEDCSAIH